MKYKLFATFGLIILVSVFMIGCDDDTTYDFAVVEGAVFAIEQVDGYITARASAPSEGSVMDRLYFYADGVNIFLIVDVSEYGDGTTIQSEWVASYIYDSSSIVFVSGTESITVDYTIPNPDSITLSYDATDLYELIESLSGINDIFVDGFAEFSGDIAVKLIRTSLEFTPIL